MPDRTDTLAEIVEAHRILIRENVLDAFGHVSMRDAGDPDRFWLAAALPPSLVQASDFAQYGLDGEPIEPVGRPLFVERYIHSEIYRSRLDVQAICHHHAASTLPFCVGFGPLFPVSQTGAFMGGAVPLWDSADEFGDTPILVTDPRQAASLARALGQGALVLMRGHGATVVGTNVPDLVYKSVYSGREAELLRMVGHDAVKRLSAGEILAAGQPRPPAIARCWAHWTEGTAAGGDSANKEPKR